MTTKDIINKKLKNIEHKYYRDDRFQICDDEDFATYDDIVNILAKQENKCYICSEKLIFTNDQDACHRFTLSKYHSDSYYKKNNIIAVCECCKYYEDNLSQPNRCKKGCHLLQLYNNKVEEYIIDQKNKQINLSVLFLVGLGVLLIFALSR